MKAIDLFKFSQKFIENTKHNYWKLKRISKKEFERKDILTLSNETRVAPVMVLRKKLEKLGYNKKQISDILCLKYKIPEKLKNEVLIALRNDPVYSPKGTEYAHWCGDEGEAIIKDWLEFEKKDFKQDPGNHRIGLPDFLLEKSMYIYRKEVKWIESKCSYGNRTEQKNNVKQFKKFDKIYGQKGCIVYWFGFEPEKNFKKRFVLTWEDMLKITPDHLNSRINKLINEIPKEFEHLLYPTSK